MKKISLVLLAALIVAAVFYFLKLQTPTTTTTEPEIKVEKELEVQKNTQEALICLQESGQITCKLLAKRIDRDRVVIFRWFAPTSPKDDRTREMILPANHASIFDRRHVQGRSKGKWRVEVEIEADQPSTSFTLK